MDFFFSSFEIEVLEIFKCASSNVYLFVEQPPGPVLGAEEKAVED